MPKVLKSCPKSNKSPNLVTLVTMLKKCASLMLSYIAIFGKKNFPWLGLKPETTLLFSHPIQEVQFTTTGPNTPFTYFNRSVLNYKKYSSLTVDGHPGIFLCTVLGQFFWSDLKDPSSSSSKILPRFGQPDPIHEWESRS